MEKIKQKMKEVRKVHKVNELKSLNCSTLSPITVHFSKNR